MRRRKKKETHLEPDDLNPEHYLYDYDYNIGNRQRDEIGVINLNQLKTSHVYTDEKGEQRRITLIKVPAGALMFYSTDMRHDGVPVFVTPRSGYPECKIAFAPHPSEPTAKQHECSPSEFMDWIGEPEGVKLNSETGWPSISYKNHGEGYQEKLGKEAQELLKKSSEGLKDTEVWAPLSKKDSMSEGGFEKNKEAKKKAGGKAKAKSRAKAKARKRK